MIFLDSENEPDETATTVGGGTMLAYSRPAPDKDSPNEDSVAAIPYGPEAAVLAIADGAGGMPAGRRASRQAIRSLEASLNKAMAETMLLRTAILDGIEAANEAVLSLANGSATTLTVVTIEGLLARTYQVGDSEAIVVGQRGKIKSQTMAHSPTGFAVEAGFLDERDALHHADRHLISNFIGTADMRIDMGAEVLLRQRDTVLLASDGLTDNLHVAEITEIIRKGSLATAMASLISKAGQRMADSAKGEPSKPDDLSVILFRKPYNGKEMSTSRPPSG